MNYKHAAAWLFSALLFCLACTPKEKQSDGFDRQAMLRNYAENLIMPAYADLNLGCTALQTAVLSFIAAPDADKVEAMRSAWKAANISWQFANAYNFGPAGEAGLQKSLVEEIGTFPASSSKIEASINSGAWNLNDFNRDARGLYAIEYLIFGNNQNPEDIASQFSGNINRSNFLAALAQNILDREQSILAAWQGNYAAEFIANDGTDIGSATSQLYNEFVRSFESIKNFKLGLPLGKRPGQTDVAPELVEAYYSGQTLALLHEHFTAIENIWNGRAKSGVDGIGFKEYLENVTGGKELVASTETQINVVKSALAQVPASPDASIQIQNDKAPLENLYVELQKMTRFFKSDMSSLLGIAITYSSGDGD